MELFAPITSQKINFVVTPEEVLFENILTASIVVDLKEQHSREEYLKTIDPLYCSIIDSPENIEYEDIIDKKGKVISDFKYITYREPVINVHPFFLSLKHKQKVSLTGFNPSGIFGLQMWYPIKTYQRNSDKEEFENVITTAAFATHSIFNQLITRIKRIGHKATIKYNEKTIKPDFWISNEAVKYMAKKSLANKSDLYIQ